MQATTATANQRYPSSSVSLPLPRFLANIGQCWLAMALSTLYWGRRVFSIAVFAFSSISGESAGFRILLPKEIVFDEKARNALQVLDEHYHSYYLHCAAQAAAAAATLNCSTTTDPLLFIQNKYQDDIELARTTSSPPAPAILQDTDSCSSSVDSDSSLEASSPEIFQDAKQQQQHRALHHMGDYDDDDDNPAGISSGISAMVQKALGDLQAAGNEDRLTLTCAGYKGGRAEDQVNQDRAMIAYPLLETKQQQDKTLLLGVLDGHGALGHLCAEFCQFELEQEITERLQQLVLESKGKHLESLSPNLVAEQVQQIVRNVDQRLPKRWGRDGGSTMSMVLQLGEWIYLINTGDSQSLVAAYISSMQETILLNMTERHVPTVPSEAQRVKHAGARISPDGAYVIYSHVQEEHGLAMTRSMGDHMALGVICTPVVSYIHKQALIQQAQQYKLSKGHNNNTPADDDDICLFAVCVSDGILDVLTDYETKGPAELATVMGRAFFQQDEQKQKQHALVAAMHFIDVCAFRWHRETEGEYRDDIVICASKLL